MITPFVNVSDRPCSSNWSALALSINGKRSVKEISRDPLPPFVFECALFKTLSVSKIMEIPVFLSQKFKKPLTDLYSSEDEEN